MSLRADERHPMSVHATDGIVQSGRRILAILRTRLTLLSVELMEEKSRIWLMLVLTALALIFGSMALLMLSLFVIVAFWDENRLLANGAQLIFYLSAAAVSQLILPHKAQIGSPVLTLIAWNEPSVPPTLSACVPPCPEPVAGSMSTTIGVE